MDIIYLDFLVAFDKASTKLYWIEEIIMIKRPSLETDCISPLKRKNKPISDVCVVCMYVSARLLKSPRNTDQLDNTML